MIKGLISILVYLLIVFSGYSQDLIVTDQKDSINCKIAKVKSDFIYFAMLQDGKILNTLLARDRVVEYKYGFYSENRLQNYTSPVDANYSHMKIGVSAGFSYLTAKISDQVPSELESYMKALKSGYHINAEISFFLSKIYGLGGFYSHFKTSNSTNVLVEDESGNEYFGELADRIAVNYLGPIFTTRFMTPDNKGAFMFTFSLGYMGYTNNATLIDDIAITGKTMGLRIGLDYDLKIADYLLLDLKFSFTGGALSKVEINNQGLTQTVSLEKGQYESLSRIELSIGLMFNKVD